MESGLPGVLVCLEVPGVPKLPDFPLLPSYPCDRGEGLAFVGGDNFLNKNLIKGV